MPTMEPRPAAAAVSWGRNAAVRARLAGQATEFIVQGPETWVPSEAVAAPASGDPDSIAAWALRKGAPGTVMIPRRVPRR